MFAEKTINELLDQYFIHFGIKNQKQDRISLRLTRYFNFRLKYIVVKTRQVLVSKELAPKITSSPHSEGIIEILYRAAVGYDLNPFQSKESFNSDYHDLLFNDWGIHHLHLSKDKKNPKDFFNSRTGSLLFVRFTDSIAYFIDIKHHKDPNVWSDRDMLRIIQRNWESSIADKQSRSAVGWSEEISDNELGELRKMGYTTGVEVDGKFYMLLGHGQASTNDNIMAGRMADQVIHWIRLNEDLFRHDRQQFVTELMDRLSM
ncbi:hypothetical protein [Dyadobacter chenhuakuii]|uniref:Uncharacterized protein n=1 Tax=Dyadobacter chenhuakuii TaxID=2909339 RepID=A0A9X1Q9W5_9BACT|nr:hypothetical protein [Dyadobacter chenhuakuii]MCF2497938.1 hypothetical protein [Dyadobacter chenhuakuii]